MVDREIKGGDRTRRPDQPPLREIDDTTVLRQEEVERLKELVRLSAARPIAEMRRRDVIDQLPRRSGGSRMPVRPTVSTRPAATTGDVFFDRLPRGVKSLSELEQYDDPVIQIPFLSSLLEFILSILFPDTSSEKRGLIREAFRNERTVLRSVNERELDYALTIRNRIIHPNSYYNDPPPSDRECRTACHTLREAIGEALNCLPDRVDRTVFF